MSSNSNSNGNSSDSNSKKEIKALPLSGMLLNLIKAYLGTGLLAIPRAIQDAGFWTGLIFLCLMCYLLNETMKMMVRMKIEVERVNNLNLKKRNRQCSNGNNNGNLKKSNGNSKGTKQASNANSSIKLLPEAPSGSLGPNSSTIHSESVSSAISHDNNSITANSPLLHESQSDDDINDDEGGPDSEPVPEDESDSKDTFIAGFPEIGHHCLGNLGKYLIHFAVCGTNGGISMGYLVGIGSLLQTTFKTESGHVPDWLKPCQNVKSDDPDTLNNIPILCGKGIIPTFISQNFNTLVWVLYPFLCGINLLRIKYLNFTSILGNVAVLLMMSLAVYISIYTLIYGMDQIESGVMGKTPNDFRDTLKNYYLHGKGTDLSNLLNASNNVNSNKDHNSSKTLEQIESDISINYPHLLKQYNDGKGFVNWDKDTNTRLAADFAFFGTWPGFAESFGILMFSFVMHGTVLGQYQALSDKDKTCEKTNKLHNSTKAYTVLDLAAVIVAILYAVYSAFAYAAFSGHGLDGNLMNTLMLYAPKDLLPIRHNIVIVTNVLLAAAIFCSIPLFLDPIYTMMGLGYPEEKSLSNSVSASQSSNSNIEKTIEQDISNEIQQGTNGNLIVPTGAVEEIGTILQREINEEESIIEGIEEYESNQSNTVTRGTNTRNLSVSNINSGSKRVIQNSSTSSSNVAVVVNNDTNTTVRGTPLSNSNQNSQTHKLTYTKIFIFRPVFLFVLTAISQSCNPDLFKNIISLVGALCMSWLGCILPAIFYWKLSTMRKSSSSSHNSGNTDANGDYVFHMRTKDGVIAVTIGILGIIGMILGSYFAGKELFSSV